MHRRRLRGVADGHRVRPVVALDGTARAGLSREQLLSEVWGYSSVVTTRTVDVHIAQLRAKLGEPDMIRTVRGVGYSAEAPPTADEA